jgi:hypothetical protein
MQNTQTTSRDIHAQAVAGLTDEQRLSMGSYSGTQRSIERSRELPERELVDKINLQEIVIQVSV